MPTKVLFSYRTANGDDGQGGQRFVGFVRAELECGGRYHINAEQYHEESVSRAEGDTECHPEWFNYWTDQAKAADAVIIFNSEETLSPPYSESKWCRKEFNWCKNHSINYIAVGGMIDNGDSSAEVAKEIRRRIFNLGD